MSQRIAQTRARSLENTNISKILTTVFTILSVNGYALLFAISVLTTRLVIYLLVKFVSAFLGLPILALSLYFSYYGARTLVTNAIKNLERECIEVQMRALKEFQPDVVIGSSWGGNILIRLINQGHWKGPTILLAPAHRLVAQKSDRDAPTIPKAFAHPVHVYHATGDGVVPFAHSEELVKSFPSAKLFKYQDDDHAISKNITSSNIVNLINNLVEELNGSD